MSNTDLGNKKCFVAMPIGSTKKKYNGTNETEFEHWKKVYDELIVPAVENSGFGLTCHRADTHSEPDVITDEIIEYLHDDFLVIIDISNNNPNVFYELGLRDCWDNKNIIITSDRQSTPFDISVQRSISYKLNDTSALRDFERDIKKAIQEIINEPLKKRNRVQKFLSRFKPNENVPSKKETQESQKIIEFKTDLNGLLKCMDFKPYFKNESKYRNFQACKAEYRVDLNVPTPSSSLESVFQHSNDVLYLLHTTITGEPDWKNIKIESLDICRRLNKDDANNFKFGFIFPIVGNVEKKNELLRDFIIFLSRNLRAPGLEGMLSRASGVVHDGERINVEIWDPAKLNLLYKEYGL